MDCAPVILWICCHSGYWGMVHWLCIRNSQATIFLNHCWYVVLLKTVINFSRVQCRDEIVRTLKTSPQFNLIDTTYSSLFHADLGVGGGGMFTKLKQCKQTTGPKSVVPGAEMHRTGGRKPSYHVIIVIAYQDNGMLPDQCQAIIWTNAGILLIRPLETNFSEMWRK